MRPFDGKGDLHCCSFRFSGDWRLSVQTSGAELGEKWGGDYYLFATHHSIWSNNPETQSVACRAQVGMEFIRVLSRRAARRWAFSTVRTHGRIQQAAGLLFRGMHVSRDRQTDCPTKLSASQSEGLRCDPEGLFSNGSSPVWRASRTGRRATRSGSAGVMV